MWNSSCSLDPFAFAPIPNSFPPPPPPPGDNRGITVTYADPEDQARYERRRAELREYQRRRAREEDPQLRRNRERLINSAHNQFRPPPPDQIDDSPDFETVVQSLYWLDQRVSPRVPPSEHRTFLGPTTPESFYQVSLDPRGPNDPRGLPVTFARFQGSPPPGHVHVPSSRPMPPELAEVIRVRAKMAENREKYVALLNATECFFAGDWTTHDMASIYDGVYPGSPQAVDSVAAAEFALSSLNARRGRGEISLKQLIRVNGQVLGGVAIIYWLTLEGSNGKFYEALVVGSQNQIERALKFIRRAKYYPEIPADCHHLIGPDY